MNIKTVNNEYNPKAFNQLNKIENKHFWFKNRKELIYKIILKYINDATNKLMLEVGCGNGNILHFLITKGIKCEGADIHKEAIRNAQKKIKTNFYQLDVKKMPFKNKYDIIGCFDVLEHIEDDILVIKNIHNSLKKKGYIILTVPSIPWLWSNSDTLALHKRRYLLSQLETIMQKNNFKIIKKSHFMFFLLPLIYISRFLNPKIKMNEYRKKVISKELNINTYLNYFFYIISRIEQYIIINLNLSFPLGSSAIIIAEKK